MSSPPTGPGSRGAPDSGGCLLVMVYLVLSLGLILAINVVGVMAMIGFAVGVAGASPADVTRELASGALPPWFLAGSLSLQFPMMLAVIGLTRWAVRRLWYEQRGLADDAPWRDVLALRPAGLGMFAVALVMGATTGWLPGWFAAWLQERLPSLAGGTLETIQRALTEGWWVWRVIIGLWVALGAAVVEELVFRGFLWDALRRIGWPTWAVWLVSSLVFAGYHMDPVQSVALLFTALTLGWLRWRSGSVLPAIVMHAVNNSLGVAGAVLGASDVDMPLPIAVAGALVTLSLWGVALHLSRGRR